MSERYDAIVIGGGHNGLVAAAYLARAGQRTLLLERRPSLGGAASGEPVFPGFQVDTGAHDLAGFRPEIVEELGLERVGLTFLEAPAQVLSLLPGGDSLILWSDPVQTQEQLRRFSQADAARFPEFLGALARMRGVLDGMTGLTPPDLAPGRRLAELLPWMRLAWRARRLGRRELLELLGTIPMPVTEFLENWFESEPLRGAIGAAGVNGLMQGPMASGTALMLLYSGLPHRGALGRRYLAGGMGRLAATLAEAARAAGATLRTEAAVGRVLLEDGRATGVELADGERVLARAVLSSADPRTTLLGLVGAPNLAVRVVRRLRNLRLRGCTAKLNLAVSELPEFACNPPKQALSGRIYLCPSLEYLERAFDDAKYGRISSSPFLEMTIPTALDPSLAPEGKQLLSIRMQYAPYHLRGSDWSEQRQALADLVVQTLEPHMPGLRDQILHQQVLTPLDWERSYALPEGCIHHGQMSLDQLLFMRPIAGFGRYRTPVEGLYFCGAGAHPGGGVSGAPGRNAALQAARDLAA